MSKFVVNGSSVRIVADSDLIVQPAIPVGTYTIKEMPMTGEMYLSRMDDRDESFGRVYGDINEFASRVVTTFLDRGRNTGVLLVGEKGSGKTLTARLLSKRMAEQDSAPTIIINEPYKGDKFNSFMASLSQRCVVLFDEFDKTYDDDDQQEILTLLDGVYQSNKLFVITANDSYRVNRLLTNRPGRMFYYRRFDGMDRSAITEYCQEKLFNPSDDFVASILRISATVDHFNFDMLKALVEEINRYEEPPAKAVRWLNIQPEGKGDTFVLKSVSVNGEPTSIANQDTATFRNPVTIMGDDANGAASLDDRVSESAVVHVPAAILERAAQTSPEAQRLMGAATAHARMTGSMNSLNEARGLASAAAGGSAGADAKPAMVPAHVTFDSSNVVEIDANGDVTVGKTEHGMRFVFVFTQKQRSRGGYYDAY